MDIHENARTLPHGRMLIVDRLAAGWSVAAVAMAAGVTAKTVRKWRNRYAAEGKAGLVDRSSRPHHSPAAWPQPMRMQSKHCDASACPARPSHAGSAALSALDPRPPIVRYEREQPGELIHIDIKKLGRIASVAARLQHQRPHSALSGKPPVTRLNRDNLHSSDT